MRRIIFTVLVLLSCAFAWGQGGRLHRLEQVDTTKISTRSYVNTKSVDNIDKTFLTAQGVRIIDLEPIRATADGYVPVLSSDSIYYVGEGEVVRVAGNQSSYEITRQVPTGETVDSFRVYEITSLAITSENLVTASEDLGSAATTDWLKEGSGRPELVQEDYYIDPFGNPADLLRMSVGSNFRALRHAVEDTLFADSYYVSFWFKNVTMATSGVTLGVSLDTNRIAVSNEETVSLITSDTAWHYYEVPVLNTTQTLLPGGATKGSIELRFFGTVNLDSFSITRISLTREPERTYVFTLGNEGSVPGNTVPRYKGYAVKYEPGQIIYWSERPYNDTLDTDAKYWNYLADLVEQKKLKTIFIDEEIIAEDTLYYTEGMHVLSNWHEGNFLADELQLEKAKITCRPENGGDCIVARPPAGATTFVAGSWKNVLIVVEDTTNYVMNMGGSHFGDYEDVTIMGNYIAEAGFRMGREAYTDSLASISNYFKGLRVFACGIGFFGDDLGNLTHIVSSQFHRCRIGMYMDGPCYIEDTQIEKSDSITFWGDGHNSRIYVNKMYVESTNYDDGPGFGWEHSAADSIAFHIQDALVFEFEGGTVATNPTNKVIFNIASDVSSIDIRNNRFLFVRDFIRLADPDFTAVNAMSNNGSGYKDRIEGDDGVMIKDVEIYGTNSTITDAELDNNDILHSVFEDNSTLRGAVDISQMYVSGERQNFIQNSNYTENLGALFAISDTVLSPFHDTKTQLIEQVGSISGTGIFATFTNTTDLLEVDSVYTFSFYAMIDTIVAASASITLFSRYNTDTSTDSDDFILTNRYKRYHNTFVASGSANTMAIRIKNDSQIGNRIKIGQFSLVKGSRPKAYVETTPTETVNEFRSQVKLQNDLDFVGNVRVTGTLNAEKYKDLTPLPYNATDTIAIDTINYAYAITDEVAGKQLTEVTYTTNAEVTGNLSIRLLYHDPATNTYTAIGAGTITTGNNQVKVTGLTQTVTSGDLIYPEVTASAGGGPGTTPANGLSLNLRFQ